jgi:HEAT repeat protein
VEKICSGAWSWGLLDFGWCRYNSHRRRDGNSRRANFAGSAQLTEDDIRSRRISAGLAGHRGETSQARALLVDPDAATRRIALGALERLNELTTAELRVALDDSNVSVRRRALEISAQRPDVEIEFYLRDPDASVADMAAFSLGERGEVDAVEGLTKMASGHSDELCRETAVAALGALATTEGADSPTILICLLDAMSDRAQIRRRAVLGLFQFDEPEAQQAVESALSDKDRQVRAVASELLGVVSE